MPTSPAHDESATSVEDIRRLRATWQAAQNALDEALPSQTGEVTGASRDPSDPSREPTEVWSLLHTAQQTYELYMDGIRFWAGRADGSHGDATAPD